MGISKSMSNKEKGCLEFGEVEDEKVKEGEEMFSMPFYKV